MRQIYFGLFNTIENVISEFFITPEDVEGIEVIFAAYDYEDYQGNAQVIFIKDGKIYEVNGSHCSCNGLEDCWEPEETIPTALLARPNVSKDAKKNIKSYYKNLLAFL